MFSSRFRRSRYRVAIEGFGEDERAALTSFFRLTERRVPAYLQVATPDDSDFLIVDADQPRVRAWVARERRITETVFIGEQAPDAAVAWLTRPVEWGALMRALDSLLGVWTAAALPEQAADEIEPIDSPDRAAPQPPMAATAAAAAAAALADGSDPGRDDGYVAAGGGRRVMVAATATAGREVLVQRLAELGYRVSVAGSSDEALEYAAWTAFSIAFIDLDLRYRGGLDSLELCQRLKRLEAADSLAVVVTTGGRGGATDRVRAALAGCDVYLSEPLVDADLPDLLHQVDASFPGSGSAAR